MKTIFLIIAIILLINNTIAQEKAKKEIKKITIKVEGNCEQCKKRIENAAYIKGVKNSSWDEKTKNLKLIYRADKVTEEQIQQAIAKSGHETPNVKADQEAYSNLPDCCKYKDQKCNK
jgi:mercuric ion binding protein